MIVISDTSCVSNLLLIGQLDLLQKIYSQIIIAPAVYSEVLELEKNGKDISHLRSQKWILLEQNFSRKISLLPPKNIDPGEAEAFDLLKIAKENNLISSVKILLDQLIENNFWLSNQLYNLVLKSVNEK